MRQREKKSQKKKKVKYNLPRLPQALVLVNEKLKLLNNYRMVKIIIVVKFFEMEWLPSFIVQITDYSMLIKS